MRRITALLALFLALTLSARAESNPTNAFAGRWKDARVPDAEMEILPEYLDQEEDGDLAVYPIVFRWKASEGRQVIWTMTARYNAKAGRLEYRDGVKTEGGSAVWRDARGMLALDRSGSMTWTDSRETDSTKLTFARALSPTPSSSDFADGYFRAVAALERGLGTSGAAKVIVQVLQFAEARDLWNVDGDAAQRNLEAAWKSLTPQEQSRFAEAFEEGISDPADEAFEDYGELKRAFEKAGVGKEMARLTASPEARLSWEFLASATMNMGNTDDGKRADAVG